MDGDLACQLEVIQGDDLRSFQGLFVNRSTTCWERGSGSGELRIGWRIFRHPAGDMMAEGRGDPLPAQIRPGEPTPFDLLVDIPELAPGTYTLEIALLRELQFWFAERGLACWRSTILVREPAAPPVAPATPAVPPLQPAPLHPYRALPDRRFWRRAVAEQAAGSLRPIAEPPFPVQPGDLIATAGSCFAQNVALFLERDGFRILRAEPPIEHGASAFSANYGNIYTARQLKQLLLRCYGLMRPDDFAWRRADGQYVDPFRPQLFANGFASADAVRDAADTHLRNVRRVFEESDVFIFTLGLTEAWVNGRDGAVLPLPPGAVASEAAGGDYGFVNFTAEEVGADLEEFITAVRLVNPDLRIILTVSPVPLVATYEDEHVLVANGYSKAALRVAAQAAARNHRGVAYFGSYEIVTSPATRGAFYAEDLRSVTPDGIALVMQAFTEAFVRDELVPDPAQPPRAAPSQAAPMGQGDGSDRAALARVLCDEELLETARE